MGILRLYLAICVVAAHSESVVPWNIHDGAVAVQLFFIISGFYMQLILRGGKYNNLKAFYQGRALKIFIPYFAILFLVAGFSVFSGLFFKNWLTLSAVMNPEGNGSVGIVFSSLTNFTVIFQDWVLFLKDDAGAGFQFTADFEQNEYPLHRYLWIPPAWSIGVELAFYAVVPFLALRVSTFKLLSIALLSLVARLMVYKSGFHHDPWTYRFFPFELMNFIIGILGCRLYLRYNDKFSRICVAIKSSGKRLRRIAGPLLLAVLLCGLWVHTKIVSELQSLANLMFRGGAEVVYLCSLWLWIIIVPALFALTRNDKLDRAIGELSYPVYLLHFTVALSVGALTASMEITTLHGEITAICTIAVALLMQIWLLRPFESWRQRFLLCRGASTTGAASIFSKQPPQ